MYVASSEAELGMRAPFDGKGQVGARYQPSGPLFQPASWHSSSSPSPARQTREASFLAAEGHDFFFCTTAAFKSQESIGRNPAFNERLEFIYDILWKRTVFGLTRLNEAVQVLVYDFEARRKLGATPLVFRGFLCLLCHPCNKALQRTK